MARTSVPVTTLNGAADGVDWPATDGTACDVVNGNYCANSATLCVMATNTGAGPFTLTFVTQATAGGFAVADDVKTLEAGEQKVYGPFDDAIFGNTLEFDGQDATVKVIPFQSTRV